jgi:DNA-binding NarL/FixJ family response regulator
MQKKSVLIADNDRAFPVRVLDSVKTIAAGEFEIDSAHSGVECWLKLRKQRPSLVVLNVDLLWGGVAGVLACLREEFGVRTIPPVLLFSSGPEQHCDTMLQPPVIQFLPGPLSMSVLTSAITAIANNPPAPPPS